MYSKQVSSYYTLYGLTYFLVKEGNTNLFHEYVCVVLRRQCVCRICAKIG